MALEVDDVRVRTLDHGWETLGADRFAGIVPEGITCDADEWGSNTFGCTLKRVGARGPAAVHDLGPWAELEYRREGLKVWAGRITQAPEQAEGGFQVNAKGWQYHLDDEPFRAVYWHRSLNEWVDTRGFPEASPLQFIGAHNVASSDRHVLLAMPQGITLPATTFVGVTFDLGPNNTAAALAFTWEHSGGAAGITFIGRSSPTPNPVGVANDAFSFTLGGASASGSSGNVFPTPHRYVHGLLAFPAGGTLGAEVWIKLKSVDVFGSRIYPALAVAGSIKPSSVIREILGNSSVPLLSSDDSGVQVSTQDILEMSYPREWRTPRELIRTAVALEDRQVMVDVNRRLVYRDRPTRATLEVSEAGGARVNEGALVDAEALYNRVAIEALDETGLPITVTATSTSSPVTARGFDRWKVIQSPMRMTAAIATVLANLYLARHSTSQFSGSVQIPGAGAARAIDSGAMVMPAATLLMPGELARLSNRRDPDTGLLGRNGRIVNVRYTAEANAAELTLDNSTSNLEILLERLGVALATVA